MSMKKNNKYRNNSNNNNFIYSLNYKFDSNSPAGKICGTALELIKKYNDLAKEALNNNDYVEAEVFRQYAEHYRKIVTEINDKKAQRFADKKENIGTVTLSNEAEAKEDVANDIIEEPKQEENNLVETIPAKKEFTIIEISASETQKKDDKVAKPRGRRPKKDVAAV